MVHRTFPIAQILLKGRRFNSNRVDTPAPQVKIKSVKFICRLSEKDGTWTAEHASQDIGPIRVTAPTRAEVLQKMEGEIRYWLEMCPCTGEAYRNLELELIA